MRAFPAASTFSSRSRPLQFGGRHHSGEDVRAAARPRPRGRRTRRIHTHPRQGICDARHLVRPFALELPAGGRLRGTLVEPGHHQHYGSSPASRIFGFVALHASVQDQVRRHPEFDVLSLGRIAEVGTTRPNRRVRMQEPGSRKARDTATAAPDRHRTVAAKRSGAAATAR